MRGDPSPTRDQRELDSGATAFAVHALVDNPNQESFHAEPTQQRASDGVALGRFDALTSVFAISASVASAAECPADKRVADGKGQPRSTAAAKGVTDVVRATTDLSKETLAVKGRQFRLRQLDVQPGGIVPWHSHDDRPAMIYIVSGEITEYASSCAAPILHKAGDVAPERKGTSHWWQNTGTVPSVLISVDLFPVAETKNEHTM